MEAYSKEAFPPQGFVSPTGDTRYPCRVWGASFGTCNMFWFVEVEDVMGITTEISTHQARDRQEKLAHLLHPAWQLKALIKIIA